MQKKILYNACIVNENKQIKGGIVITDDLIELVFEGEIPQELLSQKPLLVNLKGKLLLPGIIDDQVHFREPGLTHKGDLHTESRAAVAGGITSFMDMPNVRPQTITNALLEERYKIAATKSLANFSFYLGATNNNLKELFALNPKNNCGIKIFMGSSTGDMLVDNRNTLDGIFEGVGVPIAVHCEDEITIQTNLEKYNQEYNNNIPIECHPLIRSAEACYRSSALAVKLATKYNSRLHVLHLSTAKELSLFDNKKPAVEKRISNEVCIHHLWFDDRDYRTKGALIKWNPAIKTEADKIALFAAVINNKIDVIATDHAPHIIAEKNARYMQSASGGPMVQHSLVAMLEFHHQGKISLEKIVEKMCHTPADIFSLHKRGYLRAGYFADIAVVDLNAPWKVSKENVLAKCKWSPFEGNTFTSKVLQTYVNGNLVFDNGKFNEDKKGARLTFDR